MSKVVKLESWFGHNLFSNVPKVDIAVAIDDGKVSYRVDNVEIGRDDYLAIVATVQALAINEIAISLESGGEASEDGDEDEDEDDAIPE